jgi:hypothetical protein
MTMRSSLPNRNNERGVALIAVLMLLMIVSALCATMAISGNTETMIARNHQVGNEARAAAEAGAIHAVQMVITNLQNYQANGFPTNTAAMTGLLDGPDNLTGTPATDADNGSLEALAPCPGASCIPRTPARVALNGSPQIFYEARVLDEDDPGRGVTLTVADIAAITENAQPFTDANRRIVVRAVGYAGSDAQAVVEATIAPLPMPAIITDGDLTVTGNATLTGPGGAGSVHSNSDLDVGGSANIVGNAHASGAYHQTGNPTITGTTGGNKPPITIPPVSSANHLAKANFILNADGTMTNVATGVTAPCNPCGGAWTFGGGTWSLGSNAIPASGMYFVRGSVSISGSPGTPGSPATLGIIAEGSIDISGSADMQPPLDATGQPVSPWLVTDGDLEITGSLEATYRQSQILVREQLSIAGNADLLGQITVDDAASNFNLVTQNRVTGSAVLTNNGTGESILFAITGWRFGS